MKYPFPPPSLYKRDLKHSNQQVKKYDKNTSVQNKQTNKKRSGGDREST